MQPDERSYLALMFSWEKTAPKDQTEGLLDGNLERNTQMSRMAYLLRIVATVKGEAPTYKKLSPELCRRDGNSYLSEDKSWMTEPRELSKGWYFEGCINLEKKKEIFELLRSRCGMSVEFIKWAKDFIAGKSLEEYLEDGELTDESIENNRQQFESDHGSLVGGRPGNWDNGEEYELNKDIRKLRKNCRKCEEELVERKEALKAMADMVRGNIPEPEIIGRLKQDLEKLKEDKACQRARRRLQEAEERLRDFKAQKEENS